MFIDFFIKLRKNNIPVSLNEYLSFLTALNLDFVQYDIDKFYYLTRTSLIKHEKLFDKFDLIFGEYFKSLESIEIEDFFKNMNVSENWLKKLIEREFTEKEIKELKSEDCLKTLIEKLKNRLKDQRKRHQGGNKWIGTSGTSPFGAFGFNPMGIRIGQDSRRQGSAVKVWDKRIFFDFDDNRSLDNRGFQVALKRLRQWARTSNNEEVDIDKTIIDTAKNGFLEIKTRKEQENSVKILLFLDVGGSMDEHVILIEKLFSAAKNVFKNLNYFYFHNCLYEGVWKSNCRRWNERLSTFDIFKTYGSEYKCIFVGDAAMSPYEIMIPGGGNEHFNEESGKVWLKRAISKWPSNIWINPTPKKNWDLSQSTEIIREIFDQRMVPLTVKGIEQGTKILST